MGFVLPEIIIRKIIDHGIKSLRTDREAFDDLFEQLVQDELAVDYGENYLNEIWTWFTTTKIPVIQAWSFNAQKIPSISCHLANESEDESKSAMGDLAASLGELGELNTGVFTVMIDIGLHANRGGDHVLWLYYIVSRILFRHKMMAERFGLKLHTFSASDYNKQPQYMTENIWTRWIRFKCTTQNFWINDEEVVDVEDLNVEPAIGLEPASQIAVGLDVDIETVDTTANQGIKASRVSDDDGDEDLNI